MTYPILNLADMSPTTTIPKEENLFNPYFIKLYQQIAFAVNTKDDTGFTVPITSAPSDMVNIPNFGAYIVCVSGGPSQSPPATGDTLPTLTASLCKSTSTAAGSIAVLGSQAGTGAWAGINLTITSTATNFQIAHNRAGVTGNFNTRVIGSLQG